MYSLQCSNNQVTPFWMVADPMETVFLKIVLEFLI